jgi:choline dehydrogenase-like flavoprotein
VKIKSPPIDVRCSHTETGQVAGSARRPPADIDMRNHAYKAGTAVYQSLGATRVFKLPPSPSTHNMGTCRQSEKAQDGVCNKYGQTHDVANLFISDGSQFTTSGAENPTLTIVALAIRQADYLADQLSKNQM